MRMRKMDEEFGFYTKWFRNFGLSEHEIKKLLNNFLQDYVSKDCTLFLLPSLPENNESVIENDQKLDVNTTVWLDELFQCNSTWRSIIMDMFKKYPENEKLKVLVSNIYMKENLKLTHPSIVCTRPDIFIDTIVEMIYNGVKNGCISQLNDIASYSPFSYLCVQCIIKHRLMKMESIDLQTKNALNRISIEIEEYVENKYNHHCLCELSLSLSSFNNSVSYEDGIVSAIYYDIWKSGYISVEGIIKVLSYIEKNYQILMENDTNNTDNVDMLSNTIFHNICSSRWFLKLLIMNVFTHLDGSERENNTQDYLIKTISVILMSNKLFGQILNESMSFESTDTLDSLDIIENYFHETVTILKKLSESELNIMHFEEVSKILENPLKLTSISYGFMVWFEHNLKIKNFSDATALTTMPFFFLLFDTIINIHLPLLHHEILNVLKTILFMSFDNVESLTEFKIKKKCMGSILYLMIHQNMMHQVYEVISTYKNSSTDTSLLFYFIRKFLKIIRPPFSNDFKRLWGPFLNSDEIQCGLRSNEKESLNFFLKSMA